MTGLQRVGVIARRDYVATVLSRNFLMFLLGPILGLAFGALISTVSQNGDREAGRTVVAVITDPGTAQALGAAAKRLRGQIGDALPEVEFLSPKGPTDIQARALLQRPGLAAPQLVMVWPDEPRLIGPTADIARWRGALTLLVESEHQAARSPVPQFRATAIDPVGGKSAKARHVLARGAQMLLFVLTLMLSGLLLSNMIEEKSNKVVEMLAAAMPIDSIFVGKLLAMLAVSLTGIGAWAGALAAMASTLPPGMITVPEPALGWPIFVALCALYFTTNYLLVGGVLISIGAQAASVRDIQTWSLPTTMAQLLFFACAGAAVAAPLSPLGLFALLFPLSSSLTAVAWAAQSGVVWVHLLCLAWQLCWIAIVVRLGALAFRRGVLRSGVQPAAGLSRFAVWRRWGAGRGR